MRQIVTRLVSESMVESPEATEKMFESLSADALMYHQLYFPGRSPDLCSRLRLFSSRGLWMLTTYRLSAYYLRRRHLDKPLSPRLLPLAALSWIGSFLTVVLCKSAVSASIDMDPGVYLSDHGYLILGPNIIGSGSMIHQRVTIGIGLKNREKCCIGQNVWIGPDCILYGNISVGDGSTLLPGTVLTKNIPAGTVVGGNPARVIARNSDNSVLRRGTDTQVDVFLNQLAMGMKEKRHPDV